MLAAGFWTVVSSLGGAISFSDGTEASGIRFVHTDGSSGRRYIVETVTCGLGLIDYNNDGLLDILFLNGSPLPGAPSFKPLPTNELYRNNGDGTFTDVTQQSGLAIPVYAMGCAVADFDNDGYEDVFITNYGGHRLWRNNGHGGFHDVTAEVGMRDQNSNGLEVGAGCAFLDLDRDGWLDLFVGNYLEVDMGKATPCREVSLPIYCSPRVYPMGSNRLYRNEGGRSFRDISQSSGIAQRRGYAMGVVCSDFDNDGWTDIYVGNDVVENYLFRNLGNATFAEIGLSAGVAYDQYGDPQGTMGANVGDFNGDGRFDILVTDYQNQVNTLYQNLGERHGRVVFEDVTVATGAGTGSRPLVTWGGGFADFDNDGVPEIFTAAGHLQDTVEQYDGNTTYRQRNLLLQQRVGRFVDISAETGGPMLVKESSRGAVFGDLNNDGRIDVVVLNARSKPTLMINQTRTSNHWTTLKLVGTQSNRSAVGAVARVTSGGKTQIDEVRAGRGYQSAEDLRLHFGLATHKTIERLEVRWPSGLIEIRTNLTADRILRITEGEGSRVTR